jgi:GTP-binding protein HflX
MNRLAGTELLADAMPFATLDPTTRKIDLPDGYSVFLTDTVGFIRNLPTHLVAAFQSTLEEATLADFLVHVVDVSAPNWEVQRDAVMDTLEVLGAHDKPMLTVFNKIDRLQDNTVPRRLVAEWPNSVAIAAGPGIGMDDLYRAVLRQVQDLLRPMTVLLPYSHQHLLQECYDFGRVYRVEYEPEGIQVEAELVSELQLKLAPYRVDVPE